MAQSSDPSFPPSRSNRARPSLARAALLAGIAALCGPSIRAAIAPPSWQALLAPYSGGTPIAAGFRIDSIRRGSENDVVVLTRRPADGATVEVHILQRGRWQTSRETKSFGVAYETPRSTAAERELVTDAIAATIRSHDSGLPSPDAIPLGSGFDPSATPWWLEILRGWRGVLIGASGVLLALLWIVRSPPLTIAAAALATASVGLAWRGLPYGHPDIGGAWSLPAALLLCLGARRGLAAGREARLLALAITALALVLRAGLGPWGPLHVNGYGPRFVDGAARHPAAIAGYGPGYVELYGPITALAPANPDWAVFTVNAILSALVPLLAFVLGCLARIPRRAAAAAALLLAVDPVALRSATTEAYFSPIILFCVASAVALLLAVREIDAERAWRAAARLAAGGLLLVEAARIHPSAWVPVATVPLIVLADPSRSARARARGFFAGLLMVGGLMLATSGDALLDVFANVRAGTLIQPSAPLSWRPLALASGAAVVYALLTRRPWLALAAFAALAGILTTRHVYGQSWIWQQAYDRLFYTVPVVAAAALAAPVLRHRGLAGLLAVAVALVWVRFALPVVQERTTDHLEYRWLRGVLRDVPPECRVTHLAWVANRSVEIPAYVRPPSAPTVEMHEREPHTIEAGLAPAPCLYYVRTSVCESADGRRPCDALERRLELQVVERASFPARPSSVMLSYDRDPVDSFVARVKRVDGAPR